MKKKSNSVNEGPPPDSSSTDGAKPKKTRTKKQPSQLGWVMSLTSAMLMLYCAYVTMIEPKLNPNQQQSGSLDDSSSNGKSDTSSLSADETTGEAPSSNHAKVVDERPGYQQRYFRDSSNWNLPNTWAVQEDPALAKYRLVGQWGSLRPNIYFGMKSQVLGLAHSVQGSLATGVMWMKTANNLLVGGDVLKVRHDTAQDELQRLEWVRHDGQNYGVQRLRDASVIGGDLYTAFVSSETSQPKDSESTPNTKWIQMMQTLSEDAPAPTTTPFHLGDAKEWETKAHQELRPVTSVFYFAVDCAEEHNAARLQVCYDQLQPSDVSFRRISSNHYQATGRTKSEGRFFLDFVLDSALTSDESGPNWDISLATSSSLDLSKGIQQLLKELKEPHVFQSRSSGQQQAPQRTFVDDFGDWMSYSDNDTEENAHSLFFAWKFLLPPGQRVLIKYSTTPQALNEVYASVAKDIVYEWEQTSHQKYQQFERRFAASTQSSSTSSAEEEVVYTAVDVEAVKVGLSSLLGGIGTFMGQATISPEIVDTVEPHRSRPSLHMSPGRMTLTTATPSRTVFPRGFLWDEGFHQLVIASWAPKLTLQTLADWLHAMYLAPHTDMGDKESYIGWIPREMILGPDARQRVPILQRLLRDTLKNRRTKSNADGEASCEGGGEDERCTVFDEEHALSVPELQEFLHDIYPRLHAWVQWFLFTQAGDEYGTFRWRGRSLQDQKYIPNTLSSGLDDYPRSVLPDRREKHVDLHTWMILACEVMSEIELFLSSSPKFTSSDVIKEQGHYAEYAVFIREQLQRHHWVENVQLMVPNSMNKEEEEQQSANDQEGNNKDLSATKASSVMTLSGYFDVGLGNESVPFVLDVLCRCSDPKTREVGSTYIPMAVLHEYFQIQQMRQQMQQQKSKNKDALALPQLPSLCPPSHPQFAGPLSGEGMHGLHTRERLAAETLGYMPIPRIGYVALFPFLLQVIRPNDSKGLESALTLMEKDEKNLFLWTDFGLRSMGAIDLYYQRRNALGDAPYWRGPIWININYLALAALHHYQLHEEVADGVRQRCQRLYRNLRHAVLQTVIGNFHRTGFFWEQYDDRNGQGIRGHPFTGWTATVVNIFTENY